MAESKSSDSSKMEKCFENYILIDVGANLTNRKFSRNLESVVSRAKDAGVQKIVVSTSSLKGSKEALRLSRIYPGTLYATAGVHPHEAKTWADDTYEELKEIAMNCECVAIGECGLDYNKNFSPPEVQRQVFEQQVKLACQLRKPLCIHERDAHDDVISILEEHKSSLPPIVLYSYTGSLVNAKKYLNLGVYLCITGFLTKDSSEDGVQSLLEKNAIPLEQLLVQTDSPFMYPNARAAKLPDRVKSALTERSLSFLHRYCTFQRNEPCSLPAIVEMVAAFLNKSPEDVALSTSFNALKLFGLS
ncbi:uncharacterized protein LOC106664098 [Cimex lectularius]|uniref:Deoxyribonuclease TATDN1 n=1 Tax=Cimex lectularius TaxID=79782 RepID=A0A8I6RJC1_CIMLE|nr:uncharacterized protein LOC106664098 [Cimex lectularius]